MVLKKEAKKRAGREELERTAEKVIPVAKTEQDVADIPFGLLIKKQWEEKKRELELEAEKAR